MLNKKTVNCRLVGENTKIMCVMRRASTWSGKKYIAVTSNTKLTFHGVIVKCSDCQKTIFDLIERSQQDKSMSVAFLFYCFGLVEGTPPVFFVRLSHWFFCNASRLASEVVARSASAL